MNSSSNKSAELAEYRQRSLRASGSRRDVISATVVTLLLIGGGIGGYHYTTHNPIVQRTTPQAINPANALHTNTNIPADMEFAGSEPDEEECSTGTAAIAASENSLSAQTDTLPADPGPAQTIIPDILASSPGLQGRILWQAGKLNGLPTKTAQGLIRGEYSQLSDPADVVHIRRPEDIIQQIGSGQTQIFHISGVTRKNAILKLAVSCRSSRQSDDPLADRCDFEIRRMQIWLNNERIWWRWLPAGYSIIEANIPSSLMETSDNLLTIENEGEALCIDAVWLERFDVGPRLVAALQDAHLSGVDAAEFASACAINLPSPSANTDRTITLKAVQQIQKAIDNLPKARPPQSVDAAISQVSSIKATDSLLNALWEPSQSLEHEWQQAIGNALRRRMLPVVQVRADLIGPSVNWELWAQRFGPFVGQWVLSGPRNNIAMATEYIRRRIPEAVLVWDADPGLSVPDSQRVQPVMFRHLSGYWGGRTDRELGTLRLTTWSRNGHAEEPFPHWMLLNTPYRDMRGKGFQRKHAYMLSEAMLQWWMAGGSKLIIPGAEPGGIFFPEGAGRPTLSWQAIRLLFKMGDGSGGRAICNVLPLDGAHAWADTYWVASNDRENRTAKCAVFAGRRDQARVANIRVPVPWIGRTICTVNAVKLHSKEADPELLAPNQLILLSHGAAPAEGGGVATGCVELSLPLASINFFEFRPADLPSTPPRKVILSHTADSAPPLVYDLFKVVDGPISSSLYLRPLRTPLHFVDCLSPAWQHIQPEGDATPGTLAAWRLDAPDNPLSIKAVDNVTPWNDKSTRLTSLPPDPKDPDGLQTARLHWDVATLSDARTISFWIRSELPTATAGLAQTGSQHTSVILGTASRRQQIKLRQGVWQMLSARAADLADERGELPKWLTLWRDPGAKGDLTFEFNGFLAISDTPCKGEQPRLTEGHAFFNNDNTELLIYLQGESGKPGHWHCRLPFPVMIDEVIQVNISPLAKANETDIERFPFSFNYSKSSQIIEIAIEAFPSLDTVPDSREARAFLAMHSSAAKGQSRGMAILRCKIQK